MYNIVIFASGSGSNALKIIKHFEDSDFARVKLVVTNRKNAGVRTHAHENSIPETYIPKETWLERPETITGELKKQQINFIALAGFLLKVPEVVIAAYPNKILNIHPAILPDFGGKGMFGMHVHKAVLDAGKTETGITIHEVTANYDEGKIVFQKRVKIDPEDTPETIQKKVQELEHRWYPLVIENFLKEKISK